MSEASILHQDHDRVSDYILKNKDESCVGVFCKVTSPKRQDEKHKVYWNIYHSFIHVKNSIDFDIK